jgi:protein-S-isoprenylcysteine O-methyltransferase Ste14
MGNIGRRLGRWFAVTSVVAVGLFALSGRWTDPWLWTYTAVWSALVLYAMLVIDEDLAQERFHPPERGADSLSLGAIRLIALAHLVVGALDLGRWHWSVMPLGLRAAGVVGMVASFWLFFRAMTANRFFSTVVRIQTDRGHTVVDAGPYAVVRHPGYAGMIPAMPFSALALGSWPSLAIALVFSVLILRRVAFEDRYLQANLPGYTEYARRVRYRLIPGAW